MRPHHQGFTLIELMTAVAVAAILSSIALPSFSEYLTRGRIPEAIGRLTMQQLRLEQYFHDNRSYEDAPACATDTTSSTTFDFSCPLLERDHFVLQATGKGSMNGFQYTIDDAGTMRTLSVPPGWRLPERDCWVQRKGGTC